MIKSIYSYNDYRKYLFDFVEFKKSENARYSLRLLAKLSRLGSNNYLTLIIKGQRNLTIDNLHLLGKGMQLGPDEMVYFETLVHFNQVDTKAAKQFYAQRLKALTNQKPKTQSNLKIEELIEEWYLPAILVCLTTPALCAPSEVIAKRLQVEKAAVERAVFLLNKKGLLKREGEHYAMVSDHIIFNEMNRHTTQKKYLWEQLQRSVAAFRSLYESGAKFYSTTFSGQEGQMQLYFATLTDGVEKVLRVAEDDPSNRLFQLNLQLFPVG